MNSRIEPGIGKEQGGFVEDTWTKNVIFMVRMLSEQVIEMSKHLCFINCIKAFITLHLNKFLQMLEKYNLNGKDNQYCEQVVSHAERKLVKWI